MGQAFRRASGRITSSSSTTSSSSKTKTVVDRGPRVVPTDEKISRTGPLDGGDHRGKRASVLFLIKLYK